MAEGLREREHIRDLFGRQVGREVARAALRGGARLGGEEREIGAVFVDLTGSTSMALAMPPTEVVRLLNRFFRVVVEVVEAEGGLVNKFEGDAALCVFGAPVASDDPAGDALRAARTLAERLEREVREIGFGIGVSAGLAVAGNVGSEQRFEYTVIGDPVNEAARLCDLAKERGVLVRRVRGGARRAPAATEAAGWELTDRTVLRGRLEATGLAMPVRPHRAAASVRVSRWRRPLVDMSRIGRRLDLRDGFRRSRPAEPQPMRRATQETHAAEEKRPATEGAERHDAHRGDGRRNSRPVEFGLGPGVRWLAVLRRGSPQLAQPAPPRLDRGRNGASSARELGCPQRGPRRRLDAVGHRDAGRRWAQRLLRGLAGLPECGRRPHRGGRVAHARLRPRTAGAGQHLSGRRRRLRLRRHRRGPIGCRVAAHRDDPLVDPAGLEVRQHLLLLAGCRRPPAGRRGLLSAELLRGSLRLSGQRGRPRHPLRRPVVAALGDATGNRRARRFGLVLCRDRPPSPARLHRHRTGLRRAGQPAQRRPPGAAAGRRHGRLETGVHAG